MHQPSPENDRWRASQVRRGPRNAQPLDQALQGFLSSDEMARIRRWAKVRGALDRALGAERAAKLTPLRMSGPALVLQVSDGVLLAELRLTGEQRIIAALAAAGTAATRIIWQVAPRSLPARHG